MNINTQELTTFFKDAQESMYANKDAQKAPSTRLKSEDYHFEKDNLIYHDTYFGGRDFIGGEIVYKNKIPVWGNNYYGYILNSEIHEKDVYNFLRQALMQEYTNDLPLRGPKLYEQDNWEYTNVQQGTLERFAGLEEIYFNDKLVYKAHYHGGSIE